MTGQQYDVAIVGASIAGSTAATFLARQGAKVALIERASDPDAYKTMCTHFVQPSATPTIERLGLAAPIEAAGGVRNGIEAWTRFGWIRPRPGDDYPHPRYGYDIRRQKLDPMIRKLAADTPGVDLMPGMTVTGLLGDERPAGVTARTKSGEERRLRARLVVGADGRGSAVARWANVPGRVKPHGRFGYFAYYRDLPLVSGTNTLFWFLDPDIGYAFPQDDGLTLMAFFQTHDKLDAFRRDIEGNFVRFFDGLPNAPDIRRAERVSKLLGKLDMPNVYRPAARPGIAFVGDAALAADPVWGVGCGWAFESGEWLAEETAAALTEGGDLDAALERYRKRHRSALLDHFLVTSDYSTGRRFNPIERLTFSAAARDDATAIHFHAVGSRSIGQREFLVKAVRRAIWVSAKHRLSGAETEGATAHRDPRPAGGALLPEGVLPREIVVDGIRSPLLQAGPPEAEEAIVFVHGNPGSSRDWEHLVGPAGEISRAVAMDMPGFGRADRPEDFDYTAEGYVTFLERTLSALGVERAHLVLHDWGGPWGLEWATRNPDAFRSVVLINTGVLLDYGWHYLALIWRTPVLGELFQAATTRSGLRLALKHGNPRGLPDNFIERMYDEMDAGMHRAVRRLYRSSDDPGAVGARHAAALRPLDRPALVIWGARDPYLPVVLAERQREAFPNAEVVMLDHSGHWPYVDNPDAVAEAVLPFLEATVGAAKGSAELSGASASG